MKEFHVKSLPLKDVIGDLARVFEVGTNRDCEVYQLVLPESIGSGTIRGINFSSGLGLIFYDFTLKENVTIHYDVVDIHPTKILYCLDGGITHHFGNSKHIHHLEAYESVIVASAGTEGHVLSFSKGRHISLSSVEIDRNLFAKAFKCELKKLKSNMGDLLTDARAQHEFYHKSHLSLRHWEILNTIDEEKWTGLYQRLSLQSKATELMLWSVVEYDDDQLDDSDKVVMRKTDVELVRRAVDLIAYHLAQPLNIDVLAGLVGTNVNKLQNGFKSLYGTTVNGYVRRLRLEKACQYLETTDMTITEIVSRIGLSNHGYLSKVFKQAFGLSPWEYRKKIRGE